MLSILRTANAGVLLEIDGKKILLDGVCTEVKPYLPTPSKIRGYLLQEDLDALVYTHTHEDHFDSEFIIDYCKNFVGPVIGPAEIPFSICQQTKLGSLTVMPFETNHIGKVGSIAHKSYIIQGSKCIWFMGDASPLQESRYTSLPRPDILIVPYGFIIGRGWTLCKALNPQFIVVLHLPDRQNDIFELWQAVEQTISGAEKPNILIPAIGETLRLYTLDS